MAADDKSSVDGERECAYNELNPQLIDPVAAAPADDGLKFLAQTAMEFIRLPVGQNIFECIADHLLAWVGDAYVIVNEFDREAGNMTCRAIAGFGKVLTRVLRILGQHPVGMTLAISEAALANLRAGRLIHMPGGVYELCFERLPRVITTPIDKILNVGAFYTMGIVDEGHLLGVVVIGQKKDSMLHAPAVIETFVHQAGVALQRHQLERQLIDIGMHERQLVGQDLHDVVGQQLTGIAFLSKALQSRLAHQHIDAAQDAGKIVELTKECIAQTRRISRGLCPVDIESDALGHSLQSFAAETTEIFGVTCTWDTARPVCVYDTVVATNLFYIAKEAVNNAIKHSHCSRIKMTLKQDGNMAALRVWNNRKSGALPASRLDGIGLKTMAYRARLVHGKLEINESHRGIEVVCKFPNPAPAF